MIGGENYVAEFDVLGRVKWNKSLPKLSIQDRYQLESSLNSIRLFLQGNGGTKVLIEEVTG